MGRKPADDPSVELALPSPRAEQRSGLGLEELSAALSGMLGRGADPYAPLPGEGGGPDAGPPLVEEARSVDEHCEITPRSILEAMLFVGSPQGEGLTSAQVAGLMRGVRPAEIDALVRDLNEIYERRGCPYSIEQHGEGYRLALRPEFNRLRDKFYGRTRQARLSQAAIEVLAAVAYHEPVTSEEVAQLRGTASGPVLAQLVRRQLLRIERDDSRPRRARYATTPRFLELFGLATLADLPRGRELETP
jgi:segregation and condensation protein B